MGDVIRLDAYHRRREMGTWRPAAAPAGARAPVDPVEQLAVAVRELENALEGVIEGGIDQREICRELCAVNGSWRESAPLAEPWPPEQGLLGFPGGTQGQSPVEGTESCSGESAWQRERRSSGRARVGTPAARPAGRGVTPCTIRIHGPWPARSKKTSERSRTSSVCIRSRCGDTRTT